MKLILSWLLVALPLAWGITKSVQKAMPLFTDAPVAGPPPAAAPAPPAKP
jgi:hypothetical protein